MRERLFSTADLGRLLRVSEATVKRWADTDRIGCFRTPGGHRKFRICDIATFVESTGYEVDGELSSLLGNGKTDRVVEDALVHDDYERLARSFEARAVRGDIDGVHGMLTCLRARGICLATSVDEVVSPAFASIGTQWHEGRLSIVEEHVATNATLEAINRLGDSKQDYGPAPRVALCACLEGERHELAARAVALVLESCGYRAIHVGANTPVSDLESHLRRHPTALLAISSKTPTDIAALTEQVIHLDRVARRAGTRMVLGGQGFSLIPPGTASKLTIVDSCRELARFACDGETMA